MNDTTHNRPTHAYDVLVFCADDRGLNSRRVYQVIAWCTLDAERRGIAAARQDGFTAFNGRAWYPDD